MAITKKNSPAGGSKTLLWVAVASIALVAFFASYRFAIAQSPSTVQAATAGSTTAANVGSSAAIAGGAGGCCGSSTSGASGAGVTGVGGCCGPKVNGPKTTKAAAVTGTVQRVAVDVAKGYYDPSTIQLKAGIASEITFGQGSGCLAQVQSQQLGFAEDLTTGPKTVKLPALSAGTYTFACGMNMQSGTIVVK
jgi:hypothetical protein